MTHKQLVKHIKLFANKIDEYKIRYESYRAEAEEKIDYFSKEKIANLSIQEYALGYRQTSKIKIPFSYFIESYTRKLGSIQGGTALKFGIYFGDNKRDNEGKKIRFAKTWGSNDEDAFKNIKSAIVELLIDGEKENISGLITNKLSKMVKGKILSLYFPNKYLNVFSDQHLNHYMNYLLEDHQEYLDRDPIEKREILKNFYRNTPIMQEWPLPLLGFFLFEEFPGPPNTENIVDLIPKQKLPLYQEIKVINSKIGDVPLGNRQPLNHVSLNNPDYIKATIANKILGNAGEDLVLKHEKELLKKEKRSDLAKLVKKAKLDSYGYDIKSFEKTDKGGYIEKYIEVKASRQISGRANFFLSQNELNKAKSISNYWIYFIYGIESKTPTIWKIPNPFNPENENVLKEAISYRITINPL